MTFREKMVFNLHRLATGEVNQRRKIAPVAGAIVFSLAALFLVLSLLLDEAMGTAGFFSLKVKWGLGIPLLLAGLYLMNWSVFTFAESGGTPVPVNPPPRLVTDGPYAHVRNPMLAGIFLLFFGIGLLLSSFVIVFIFTPLFIVLNVAEVKTVEEPELAMRLGKDYLEYKAKTPMFIPWPKGNIL